LIYPYSHKCALKNPRDYATSYLLNSERVKGRMFENSMLKIPRLRIDQIIEGWTKLHNEVHNFHSSPNIITKIRPRRIKWAGHVAHKGGNEKCI
jgi:hypothetical protein